MLHATRSLVSNLDVQWQFAPADNLDSHPAYVFLRALIAATGTSSDLSQRLTVFRLTPGKRLISRTLLPWRCSTFISTNSPLSSIHVRSNLVAQRVQGGVNFMLLLAGQFNVLVTIGKVNSGTVDFYQYFYYRNWYTVFTDADQTGSAGESTDEIFVEKACRQ